MRKDYIRIRLSAEEKERLKNKAAARGQTISDLVRRELISDMDTSSLIVDELKGNVSHLKTSAYLNNQDINKIKYGICIGLITSLEIMGHEISYDLDANGGCAIIKNIVLDGSKIF